MNTTEMVQIALDLAQLQELPLDSSVSVPGENITRVLAGIDMGAAELTLARQLGYDCVAGTITWCPAWVSWESWLPKATMRSWYTMVCPST